MAIVYTSDDLAVLKEALITGAQSVEIGDRKITFRNQSDLLRLIKLVTEQLDGDSTTLTSSPNLIQSTFGKGRSS